MKIRYGIAVAMICQLGFPGSASSGDERGEGNYRRAAPKLIKMEPRFDEMPPEIEHLYFRPGQPLQGQIKHSEFLPPVSSSLMPGAQFNESELSKFHPDDVWMWVPKWLAGKFSTVYHKQIFKYDFHWHRIERGGEEQLGLSADDFGQQRDAAGNFWTFLGCPYSNRIVTEHGYVYQIYSHVEPIMLSSKCIAFKAVLSAVSVSSTTHMVSNVVQLEGISERKPIDADHVRVEDSVKSFDQNGRPLQLVRTTSIAARNSDFDLVNRVRGVNLQDSLKKFLMLRNSGDLVPQSWKY